MGGIRCSLGDPEWHLGHDSGLEQGIWDQRGTPLVEDFDHRFRTNDFAGNFGPDRTRWNALWQPVGDDNQSPFRLACSFDFLAHHAVVGDRNAALLVFRFALPLCTKLKRSTVGMEYTRCGCSNFVVGRFYPAPSDLSTLQLFPNNLWRPRRSGHPSAVAISNKRGPAPARRVAGGVSAGTPHGRYGPRISGSAHNARRNDRRR